MHNYYQQNKNKINRITSALNKGFKTREYRDNILCSGRALDLNIKDTDLYTFKISIWIKSIVNPIKVIEYNNFIYWCVPISENFISTIDMADGKWVIHANEKIGLSKKIEGVAEEIIETQLSTKSFKFLIDKNNSLHSYIKDVENYGRNSSEDERIIKNSVLYKNIISTIESLINSKVTVERHPKVTTHMRDDTSLFPVVWYDINHDTYNVQKQENSKNKISIYGREDLSSDSFESHLNHWVLMSVINLPISNWGVFSIDCPLISEFRGNK